jgi:hypothetical protein
VGREAAGDADEQAAASTQEKGTTTEKMRRIGPVCPRASLPSPALRASTPSSLRTRHVLVTL